MDDNNTKLLKSIVITLTFPIIILFTFILYIGITKSKHKKINEHVFKHHEVKIKIDEKCKINSKITKENYILFEMASCKQNLIIPVDKPNNYYIINMHGESK